MEPDLGDAGLSQRLALPSVAFNRKVGAFAGIEASPDGGQDLARPNGSTARAVAADRG